jgi:TPR repeat protein
MYANGRCAKLDYGKAVQWWQKTADQGHANAQFNIGVAYAEV